MLLLCRKGARCANFMGLGLGLELLPSHCAVAPLDHKQQTLMAAPVPARCCAGVDGAEH